MAKVVSSLLGQPCWVVKDSMKVGAKCCVGELGTLINHTINNNQIKIKFVIYKKWLNVAETSLWCLPSLKRSYPCVMAQSWDAGPKQLGLLGLTAAGWNVVDDHWEGLLEAEVFMSVCLFGQLKLHSAKLLSHPTNLLSWALTPCVRALHARSSSHQMTMGCARGGYSQQEGDPPCQLPVMLGSQPKAEACSKQCWPASKAVCNTNPCLAQAICGHLAKHTSASEINEHWHVSLNGIALTDKSCADHIASLAWRATGYRFR